MRAVPWLLVVAATVLSFRPCPAQVELPKQDSGDVSLEESRAWYLLQPAACQGLLHGMPQRLGRVVKTAAEGDPVWTGVDDGGRLELEIAVEGGAIEPAEGEIFVGFFADPAWSAHPLQVRRFPGPGKYAIERLPPGEFHLGATIGTAPNTLAKGLHRQWPKPVEIVAGDSTEAQLRLSPRYHDRADEIPQLQKGFAAEWGELLDLPRRLTVRTTTPEGEPAAFAMVTLGYAQAGADSDGCAFFDPPEGPFSLRVDRFDLLPETQTELFQSWRLPGRYEAKTSREIEIAWEPFPTGTGQISGRVRDQSGNPLREYYLLLSRMVEEADGEFRYIGIKTPIIDAEGRFEVGKLPPGEYGAGIQAFDVEAYRDDARVQRFTIPDVDGASVHRDFEVEAKELLHGVAVYENGAPIHPGSLIAWPQPRRPDRPEGHSITLETASDGSFRLALSAQDRRDLIVNSAGLIHISDHGGMIGSVHIDKLGAANMRPYPKIVFSRMAED